MIEIVKDFLESRREQWAGGAWIFGGLLWLTALLTYHKLDPSLNRASSISAHNWLGYPGAVMADLSYQLLGIATLFAALFPLIWGSLILNHQRMQWLSLRLGVYFPFLIAASLLFSFLPKPSIWPFACGLGGVMGDFLSARLTPAITKPGTFFAALFLTLTTAGFAIGLTARGWRRVGEFIMDSAFSVMDAFRFLQQGLLAEKNLPPEPEVKRRKARPKAEKKHAPPVLEKRVKRESRQVQSSLHLQQEGEYSLPAVTLLKQPPKAKKQSVNEVSLSQNAKLLESVLQDFGVSCTITSIRPGPVVTLYELEPSPGTRTSRVIGLADDIARSMSAVSCRVAVIPGKNAIGIELPNVTRETVLLRELIESAEYQETGGNLPVALGKDIAGSPIVVDLGRMPHLLVAGTTGSGKSVAINAMILSLVYHLTPDQCKFIMIDPKMLELSIYDGIPHLIAPVVTESGKAVVALKWAVKEMENRYRLMSNLGVRNVEGYNKRLAEAKAKGEKLSRTVQTGFDPDSGKPIFEEVPFDMTPLPWIVVIVDEMADLMIVAGKDIEASIQRLAQMARAAGIHIIMATQRPSVDVITGVIKANFPTRISFQVTSRHDSRTILGEQGAEYLLGQGDMLYMAGGGRITRVHGPFVSDHEVEEVVAHLKSQGEPTYLEAVTADDEESSPSEMASSGDTLYDQALGIVTRDRKASTSYLQRVLKIGYNRAADLIDRMEREGVVSPANHVGKREVLMD